MNLLLLLQLHCSCKRLRVCYGDNQLLGLGGENIFTFLLRANYLGLLFSQINKFIILKAYFLHLVKLYLSDLKVCLIIMWMYNKNWKNSKTCLTPLSCYCYFLNCSRTFWGSKQTKTWWGTHVSWQHTLVLQRWNWSFEKLRRKIAIVPFSASGE